MTARKETKLQIIVTFTMWAPEFILHFYQNIIL